MKTLHARIGVRAIGLGVVGVLIVIWLTGLPRLGATEPAAAPPSTTSLTIHEWGTFTSLQDEQGRAIGGINTDDEPVPSFVHRLAVSLLLSPTEAPNSLFKGIPQCHPDVTMRLETPVLYFHPSDGQPAGQHVNVKATFHGGWLTEFYPVADVNAPGVNASRETFGHLQADTAGSLDWQNLELGGEWPGPATKDHVWTAPRAVQAANVRTDKGEAERFLFYRGVAHLDAPVKISREGDDLVLRSQVPAEVAGSQGLKLQSLWLVDIKPDGRMALRELPAVALDGTSKVLARTSDHFASSDYRGANLEKLRSSLHHALLADGLYDDEAQALLNTWELSYFKSAGMRVFFLVPRAWTDHYLPLEVSVPADVNRTMVGRIELVTPEQRDILGQLARYSEADLNADGQLLDKNIFGLLTNSPSASSPEKYSAVAGGKMSLATAGLSVPKSYQLYLRLGRFRNALVLDQQEHHPASGLANLIAQYQLVGYKPVN